MNTLWPTLGTLCGWLIVLVGWLVMIGMVHHVTDLMPWDFMAW